MTSTNLNSLLVADTDYSRNSKVSAVDMKRWAIPLFLLSLGNFSWAARTAKGPVLSLTQSKPPSISGTIPTPKSRFDRYIEKVFANADTNQDGTVKFDEVYELVLKIYVKLNRQAPIPAPSREFVMKVYRKSDKNKDNSLTREEFKNLVKTISRNAFFRVASFKLVKLVGAPLLAEYLISTFSGKEWLPKLAAAIIPSRYHEKVLPIITSQSFCRAVLLVLLVMFLGHIVLDIVDIFIAMTLKTDGEAEF
eukprot:scaffold345_cov134-Cylindrotheca_fusiformis.AAC.21